jgi:Mg2+ and Co2+ transporter CorA
LVALKESQAVERLTRTTILLAKATILFLPVSLMTGYFSIQLHEIDEKYSLKTYWLSFLVVTILSILFLLVFNMTAQALEGKTVYRSITRTIGRTLLNAAGAGKRKAQ